MTPADETSGVRHTLPRGPAISNVPHVSCPTGVMSHRCHVPLRQSPCVRVAYTHTPTQRYTYAQTRTPCDTHAPIHTRARARAHTRAWYLTAAKCMRVCAYVFLAVLASITRGRNQHSQCDIALNVCVRTCVRAFACVCVCVCYERCHHLFI